MLILAKESLIIDDIYWERVQLYIEGHTDHWTIKDQNIYLQNLTETTILQANHVSVDGSHFKARFNVAILNDGSYLPSDDYLICYKGQYNYIAQINPELLERDAYELTEEDDEALEEMETENQRNNYLLKYYSKTFKKGGNSKKTQYSVTPKISSEVNEFVLHVKFKQPAPKKKDTPLSKLIQKYRKFSYNVRLRTFKSIFNIVKFFRLRKGNTILFTSDSRSNMSGNFKFVYDELLRQHLDDKYHIHSVFKSNIAQRRSVIDKFRFPYLLGKADYIFVDDFHPLLYKLKFRRNQEIIQLWHAVGAFKTVGFSRAGKKGGPMFNSPNHRNYTKAIVSSENDIPFYGEAFGIKERNILPTGIPRTDIFFNEAYKEDTVAQIEDEIPQVKGKQVILFAPTFRGNGHRSAHYPFFKIDFKRLADYCESHNAVVLFKMHPFVKNKLTIPHQYQDYFIDVSDYREVNDILFITDILISDYSSLVYEFALFEKPMLFYAFDLEDYIQSRDFYEPYKDFVPGKIVTTFDQLLSALYNKDFEQEKVPRFVDKHFKDTDGRSSERVVRSIFGTWLWIEIIKYMKSPSSYVSRKN